MILKNIVSFGSTTLSNTTSHRSLSVQASFPTTIVKALQLPGGGFYDPLGSAAASKYPETITYAVLIYYSTEANCEAAVATISGLIGTKATLTGTKIGGATTTCSARLTQVTDNSPQKYQLSRRRLTLTFQPFSNWT